MSNKVCYQSMVAVCDGKCGKCHPSDMENARKEFLEKKTLTICSYHAGGRCRQEAQKCGYLHVAVRLPATDDLRLLSKIRGKITQIHKIGLRLRKLGEMRRHKEFTRSVSKDIRMLAQRLDMYIEDSAVDTDGTNNKPCVDDNSDHHDECPAEEEYDTDDMSDCSRGSRGGR